MRSKRCCWHLGDDADLHQDRWILCEQHGHARQRMCCSNNRHILHPGVQPWIQWSYCHHLYRGHCWRWDVEHESTMHGYRWLLRCSDGRPRQHMCGGDDYQHMHSNMQQWLRRRRHSYVQRRERRVRRLECSAVVLSYHYLLRGSWRHHQRCAQLWGFGHRWYVLVYLQQRLHGRLADHLRRQLSEFRRLVGSHLHGDRGLLRGSWGHHQRCSQLCGFNHRCYVCVYLQQRLHGRLADHLRCQLSEFRRLVGSHLHGDRGLLSSTRGRRERRSHMHNVIYRDFLYRNLQ